MQAGFPVAPQAPVALQPRQMIQPLPTGTERTLVAVPQFGAGARECLGKRSASGSGNGSGGAIRNQRTRHPCGHVCRDREPQPPSRCRCLDCRLRRWILPLDAAPVVRSASVAKSEVVNRPGSLPQDSDRTSRAASHPAEPDFACVPAPDGCVDHNGANGCGRQRRESGRRRTAIAGGRDTGPVAWGHRSSDGTTGPGQPCCQEFRATGRREPCAASCAAIHRGDAAELAPCGSDSTFRG